jgi:hypothetical protein
MSFVEFLILRRGHDCLRGWRRGSDRALFRYRVQARQTMSFRGDAFRGLYVGAVVVVKTESHLPSFPPGSLLPSPLAVSPPEYMHVHPAALHLPDP